jgi:hypothetical protein
MSRDRQHPVDLFSLLYSHRDSDLSTQIGYLPPLLILFRRAHYHSFDFLGIDLEEFQDGLFSPDPLGKILLHGIGHNDL